jgi:aryl-alcohol dehydrogenase-like predicted oxidoreductase
MEAYMICERCNLIKPICEQPQYNLFSREKMENEYAILFQKYRMGTTIWSPLFGGVLTGKYMDGIPTGSRGDLFANTTASGHFNKYKENKSDWDQKLTKLTELAKRLGFSLTNLAIAWCVKYPNVSTCILGASNVNQMEENLKAMDLLPLLTEEVEKEIEEIMKNTPEAEMNFMNFTRKEGWRKRFLESKDI